MVPQALQADHLKVQDDSRKTLPSSSKWVGNRKKLPGIATKDVGVENTISGYQVTLTINNRLSGITRLLRSLQSYPWIVAAQEGALQGL